jgi:hypothetical protein
MGNSSLVTDCTVRHTGSVPGMGNPEHSYIGINFGGGNNDTVQYSTVTLGPPDRPNIHYYI